MDVVRADGAGVGCVTVRCVNLRAARGLGATGRRGLLGATNAAKVNGLSGLWDAWAARVGVQPWDQVKARQKKR